MKALALIAFLILCSPAHGESEAIPAPPSAAPRESLVTPALPPELDCGIASDPKCVVACMQTQHLDCAICDIKCGGW